MDSTHYIRRYEDVIEPDICQAMIELFESNPDQYDVQDNALMDFTQINLIENEATWGQFTNYLAHKFSGLIERYKDDCGIEELIQFPQSYIFEQFRMKKYEADKGEFRLHTDVGDHVSAKRFLVFFVYLNEGEGGNTTFPYHGVTVPRKTGSVLMFPPTWTYPHSGDMPIGAPKYIVGSYLHYT